MPAGFLCNTGYDVTVFALADHQGGVIGSIGLEVADGREEHLVPAAQENSAAILQIFQPWLLVFDVQAEGPAIGADDVIKRALNLVSQEISIFFKQRDILSMQMSKLSGNHSSDFCKCSLWELRPEVKTNRL